MVYNESELAKGNLKLHLRYVRNVGFMYVMKKTLWLGFAILFCLGVHALTAEQSIIEEPSTLKGAFEDAFHVGAALNPRVFCEKDKETSRMVVNQFNSISPVNVLKWSLIQPVEGVFTFEQSDAFVRFGTRNQMSIHAHVLVWHQQLPDWVFTDKQGHPACRELLLERLDAHIRTLVGRYKGQVTSWDVVNEAIQDDGTLRETKWRQIIGGDYIEKAFIWAHEADPQAQLFYNDYNMAMPGKRKRVIQLIKNLKKEGVPVHAVGMQGHWELDRPSLPEIEKSIISYAAAGVQIMVSELDINVLPAAWKCRGADIRKDCQLKKELDPYREGLPQDLEIKLAKRYAELFTLFRKHRDKISCVTFWGATDRYSWLNNWPVRGRTNHPLLFDREVEPKPAFHAVIEVGTKPGEQDAPAAVQDPRS